MESAFDFLHAMIGERPIEMIAVVLGIANITLLVRRSIWNYPFGIAMVTLYAWIFFGAKLYSDVLLQGFFFVVQIYGWAHWLGRRDAAGLVIVERLSKKAGLIYAASAAAGITVLGGAMAHFTDASFPFWDASIAVLSVCAQIMLARRILENWIVWVVVDLLAIGLYWAKDLQPTAALYAVFLAIATLGFFEWRKAWKRGAGVEA
ncbi:nicotinamide riboside transporter PnuC [Hyphococcus sp.]|uniref:nicotinamide riboside transporter PnuC n=1 Tax=Hyphococcus sp. TaxID=2038636 RepID=UPI00207EEA81|nr:MAG: transporter [Marinicaulis sp.]